MYHPAVRNPQQEVPTFCTTFTFMGGQGEKYEVNLNVIFGGVREKKSLLMLMMINL